MSFQMAFRVPLQALLEQMSKAGLAERTGPPVDGDGPDLGMDL